MMQPLLNIKNLSVDFVTNDASIHALQNISFDVNRGEVVALVGESGSGKSITSLSILKLLSTPPGKYVSGEILFNYHGHLSDTLQLGEDELQQIRGNEIAMIFQEPMTSLNPVIQCGKQVAEAIRIHKKTSQESARDEVVELFKSVQLPDPENIYHRYPHELSGGQKQRVMIAMAMSCKPSLLICDEPTTALDVTVQKNILLLIKQLQQQNNMGVIFISHDLSVVADIADKIVVMYKGKIVEQNTTGNILHQPQHPYTKALLACRPGLHQKNERLPVVSDFMQVDNEGNIMEKEFQKTNVLIDENPSPTDQSAPIISVQHLKVWFPAATNFFGKVLSYNKAVDDISFDIFRGETLGLVGGSGSGKTTTGRAILQLLRPASGNVFFNGNDLTKATASQLKTLRKEMQIIFQDPYSSLNPQKKIGDAIAEPLIVHKLYKSKEVKEQVMQLLNKVGLSADVYHRYPHEFSGGQRQRIVIARALALNPSFIVCDESLSALDVSVQAQVLNLLNDLKKEFNFTALFISHDLSVVRYLCDRIIVMNKGKIEEIGTAEQVYNHPKSHYTKMLLASIPSPVL